MGFKATSVGRLKLPCQARVNNKDKTGEGKGGEERTRDRKTNVK
jgi:hypothetical protein